MSSLVHCSVGYENKHCEVDVGFQIQRFYENPNILARSPNDRRNYF